jgi:hypothetical protein
LKKKNQTANINIMSSSIRPVSRRFPESKALWDDTALPMCAVFTPLSSQETVKKIGNLSLRLNHVLRCLYCGAPHISPYTYKQLEKHDVFLCYLCGKVSSVFFDEQMNARHSDGLEDLKDDENEKEEWPFTLSNSNIERDVEVHLPLYNDRDYISIPANSCPPVWWIVLDATMPQSSPYWKIVAQSLQDILTGPEDGPPSHVHVGLILASHDTLSSWDLASPVPQVCHYPLSKATGNSNSKSYTSENISVDLTLAPMDPLYQPCIQAALRAVADNPSLNTADGADGMALGGTLEVILEFMEQAEHPGDLVQENDQQSDMLRYAGGKISCFLGRPPQEIKRKPVEPQPSFGHGGIGGAIHDPFKSEKWSNDLEEGSEDDGLSDDLTPSNLAKYCEPLEPTEDSLDTIGIRCANAAMGVDIIIVEATNDAENGDDDEEIDYSDEDDGSDDEDDSQDAAAKESPRSRRRYHTRNRHTNFLRPFYGIPLLRVLTESSGAPGPIMIRTAADLTNQVKARTPWQAGMAFGTKLRVRMSPGWNIEDIPIEPIKKATHQLALFLSSGGMTGPAIAMGEGMFLLGSCDPHTSVTLDVDVTHPSRKVNLEHKISGLKGRAGLKEKVKPCIQTCVAFTRIENDDESGEPCVVRKMRISSCSMPMADDTESIYDALDPEALASVLVHKLSLHLYERGLLETQELGTGWLKFFLSCVYKSALKQVERDNSRKIGVKGTDNSDDDSDSYDQLDFVADDRLLMSNNEQVTTIRSGSNKKKTKAQKEPLEVDDVLLGKGHNKVAALPPIVYAILQCDAIRPSPNVSPDTRCAAISQMASMIPSDLVKCIAPSLQLWSAKKDAPIQDNIDLSLRKAIKAMKASSEVGDEDMIFVLNSPQQALVYKATLKEQEKKFKLGLKPYQPKSPNLNALVQSMVNSYRTKPLSTANDQGENLSYKRFVHAMIEDYPTTIDSEGEGGSTFEEWRANMATLVQM